MIWKDRFEKIDWTKNEKVDLKKLIWKKNQLLKSIFSKCFSQIFKSILNGEDVAWVQDWTWLDVSRLSQFVRKWNKCTCVRLYMFVYPLMHLCILICLYRGLMHPKVFFFYMFVYVYPCNVLICISIPKFSDGVSDGPACARPRWAVFCLLRCAMCARLAKEYAIGSQIVLQFAFFRRT